MRCRETVQPVLVFPASFSLTSRPPLSTISRLASKSLTLLGCTLDCGLWCTSFGDKSLHRASAEYGSAVHCSAVHCTALHYSAVQYRALQCSVVATA